MKTKEKDKIVLIPDEFVLDYSWSEEERERKIKEHRKKTEEAFRKLFGDDR
ncbi:MAG: hypothetical protein GX127_08395 [Eubacteriaceae bacterium]|nr:hypothetical protein [Eubacteriaceae bacterium]